MTPDELKRAIEKAEVDWKLTIGDAKEYCWQVCLELYAQRDKQKIGKKNKMLTQEHLN